jgi:hypothetical protein
LEERFALGWRQRAGEKRRGEAETRRRGEEGKRQRAEGRRETTRRSGDTARKARKDNKAVERLSDNVILRRQPKNL